MYMYSVYEPRPEKICHRGLRPGQKLAASQVDAVRSDMRL